MGCCMSSQTFGAPKPQDQVRRKAAMERRAALPTSEEEAVKEVLSETPAPPKVAAVSIFPEPELYRMMKKQISDSVDESKDVSEVCSLSESASAATDYFGVQHHHQRAASRSPAKVQSFRNPDLGTRREHVRRSNMSPCRSNGGSVRNVQSRAPSRPQSAPRRRDPGEVSGRRSRSPATRIENAGQGGTRQEVSRSPSVRRTNPSPGRARADLAGHGGGRNIKNPGNTANSNGDDYLENPLVSLECFIFL